LILASKKSSISNITFLLLFAIYALLFVFLNSVWPDISLWTQANRISHGAAFSSDVDACSRDDEVYVVWSDDRMGNKEVFFTFSLNAGHTWEREERLTQTDGESIQPAIACDRKNLYVVWREKTEESSQIFYKRWDGISWSEEYLISNIDGKSKQPEIANTTLFPGSYLYTVWETEKDGKVRAYLAISTDGGRSFSDPQLLTQGNWDTKEPAVWGGVRDVYVTWVDNREGDWNIYFRRWGEVNPGPEAKLSAVPDCSSPAINGLEPNIYVAWQCVAKGEIYSDIFMASSINYGTNWGINEKLTEGEAESISPKITVSFDIPWFFWQDGRNGEWQIFYWSQTDDTQSITSADTPAIMVDAVSTPGQIHSFWTDPEIGIIYRRQDTVPPEHPGAPSHLDLTAVPGYDDDNQVTFSWNPAPGARIGEVSSYNVYSRVNNGSFAAVDNTNDTSYNLTGESDKTYQIYVEAVDEVGNVSAPSGLSAKVLCDPDTPEVVIHSPNTNSTIRGDISVIVSVHDLNLLDYTIEYGFTAAPNNWQQLAGPFQEEADRARIMIWDTWDLDGIYTVRIMAKDKAGNNSKAQAVINIDSRPPMLVSFGDVIQITDPDEAWTYGSPAWSPDGNRITFHSDEGGTEDIWILSSNGDIHERLTRDNSIEHNPSWSPSGDRIAFQVFKEDSSWDIWVMKSNGEDARQITSDPGADMNPSWSSDGLSLAFDSDRDGDGEIFIVTNIQDVFSDSPPNLIQLTLNSWEDEYPTWSPDGSRIAFQSSRRGNWDLFEIGIDGSNLNIILDSPARRSCHQDWKIPHYR